MSKTMKKFSEEYKLEAVKLVEEQGLKSSEVSKDLEIGKSTLDKWVKNYRSTKPQSLNSINEQEEVRQLKAENHKLRLERDLLKRATIFFANNRLN